MVRHARFAWDDPRGRDLEPPSDLFDDLDDPLPELPDEPPHPRNVRDAPLPLKDEPPHRPQRSRPNDGRRHIR